MTTTLTVEMEIEVEASNARRSTCVEDPRGVDVDVILRVGSGPGSRELKGAVTLLPRAWDGRLAMWGDMDHWMSSDLCRVARDLTDDARRELCEAIEEAAREAIDETADAAAQG